MTSLAHSILALTLGLYMMACGNTSSPTCVEIVTLADSCQKTWEEASGCVDWEVDECEESETDEPRDRDPEQECAGITYDEGFLECLDATLKSADCTSKADVEAVKEAMTQCGESFGLKETQSDTDEEGQEGCEGERDCGDSPPPPDGDDHERGDEDHDHGDAEEGEDEHQA